MEREEVAVLALLTFGISHVLRPCAGAEPPLGAVLAGNGLRP
jgi:hypothetical protein